MAGDGSCLMEIVADLHMHSTFSDGRYKSNFLCNLGYGDETKLLDRLPRFKFSEVCKIL